MTAIIGQKLLRYPSIDSTCDEAKRLISSGISEGTVIVSSEQTKGRGKPGSSWFSPANVGLYMSVILKPFKNPQELIPLTLLYAEAVVETILEIYQLTATIKHPNDVLLNGKKVCGILVERLKNGELIIGMGININNPAGSFPTEIGQTATSLLIESGRQINIFDFENNLLSKLNSLYLAYLSGIC
ncbi:MAG: biotin--[acetyl-CoA-carboxylase] ligase [Candidatus Margulisiibacteriota bacterium]